MLDHGSACLLQARLDVLNVFLDGEIFGFYSAVADHHASNFLSDRTRRFACSGKSVDILTSDTFDRLSVAEKIACKLRQPHEVVKNGRTFRIRRPNSFVSPKLSKRHVVHASESSIFKNAELVAGNSGLFRHGAQDLLCRFEFRSRINAENALSINGRLNKRFKQGRQRNFRTLNFGLFIVRVRNDQKTRETTEFEILKPRISFTFDRLECLGHIKFKTCARRNSTIDNPFELIPRRIAEANHELSCKPIFATVLMTTTLNDFKFGARLNHFSHFLLPVSSLFYCLSMSQSDLIFMKNHLFRSTLKTVNRTVSNTVCQTVVATVHTTVTRTVSTPLTKRRRCAHKVPMSSDERFDPSGMRTQNWTKRLTV